MTTIYEIWYDFFDGTQANTRGYQKRIETYLDKDEAYDRLEYLNHYNSEKPYYIKKVETKGGKEMNEDLLIEKSYVQISSYREKAIKSIGEEFKTPTTIAHDCDILTNHISKTLKELKDHELAECINPEMRKGRLYRLTPKGLKILEVLD